MSQVTQETSAMTASTPPDEADRSGSADHGSAVSQMTTYLITLGVGEDAAQHIAETIDRRLDPELTDRRGRVVAMLESFDQWVDRLPDALGVKKDADRVAAVLAMHLGRLLDTHPEALEDDQKLLADLRDKLEDWPHGVLPKLTHQEMHRQPLGELPIVMRSAFWSTKVRWPAGPNSKPANEPAESADANAGSESPG